ncbi:hypothetical protein LPJ75_001163 [Coemansia sp. RSA 2598]|nr:hypothetical protein LPJ75_001163 [Coemansia sp. RSA 2598]
MSYHQRRVSPTTVTGLPSFSQSPSPSPSPSPSLSPSPLRDTASWPRRRNPLPPAFLHHGLSPRGKQRRPPASARAAGSGGVTIGAAGFDNNVSDDSFWDSDTVSAYSNSAHCSSPCPEDPGDTLLAMQAKQYRRTIDDLTRRVESSESEIARHLVQIAMLEEQIEDARRQGASDKHECQQQKNVVRWQEEQLRLKHEEIAKLQKRHASALRMSENKHRYLIDELKAKLASANDEIRQLTRRIKDMARLLERSQLGEQESHRRCALLDAQLSDAQILAAEASRLSTDLTGQLSERATYIGDLEQKIASLMNCFCASPSSSIPAVLGASCDDAVVICQEDHGCLRSRTLTSLHAEIAQATQLIGQLSLHHHSLETKPSDAEPLLEDGHDYKADSGIFDNNNDRNDCGVSCVLSTAANHAAPMMTGSEGRLYWLAVYIHMIWSFYLRLWVWPVWRCICVILGIFMDILACRPVVRAFLALLLVPYKPVRQVGMRSNSSSNSKKQA